MDFALAAQVVFVEERDDTVLLDQRVGGYWRMNPCGGLVLRALLAAGRWAAVAVLVDLYEISAQEAAADVDDFVRRLREADLLVST
ncbi:PqqD family peptide modification chaperone [Kutzneria albida]|uniref:Coenzyme PQQ synthesis protein D (PqqD) n=1 Tax=Kutzneria albida DSM 43870 TaxID=1449976 RepID=W5W722_9PSEU|nr:PqqD family peptide modification chaperone [Kutzneria albida]AHH96973.1 hypothetical protein KALB_3609 [Kutzneria albida DSM 43870]